MSTGGDERTAEIAANLDAVRARIDGACRAAGRDPSEITLVVVTKTYPAADVIRLASLGVREVGENRDQEAAGKAAEVAAAGVGVRWHFVGQLQRNKCRSVVRYASMVHSVDSVRLAQALSQAAVRHTDQADGLARRGLPGGLECLVQVSLDGDPQRGGAIVDERHGEDLALDRVLAAIAAAESLSLRGLMAVAPLEWEPERAFATLAAIAARVRTEYPGATVLSAGMSDDVEQAIRHGATHVRMGTAVLGVRSRLM
jgi:pyridoxal phosphate enzyme (YggS family)